MQIKILSVGQMQANCYLVYEEKTGECLIIDPGDDAEFIIEMIGRLSAELRLTHSRPPTWENLKHKNKNYYRDKENIGIIPIAILATHGHFDHVMAAFEIQLTYNIPFYIHQKDQFLLDRMQETAEHFLGNIQCPPAPQKVTFFTVGTDGSGSLKIGSFNIQSLETPGHTPGSVSIFVEKPWQGFSTEPHNLTVFCGDVMFANGGMGRTDFSYCSQSDLLKSIQKLLQLPSKTIIYPGHGKETSVSKEKNLWK